jgi:enamine deaminase RidA (YjgF/YER057c/UK114 family)
VQEDLACHGRTSRPVTPLKTCTDTRAPSAPENQVFVSGTTAHPPHLDGDSYVQAKAVLAIIADALAEAGAGMQHVVRTGGVCHRLG